MSASKRGKDLPGDGSSFVPKDLEEEDEYRDAPSDQDNHESDEYSSMRRGDAHTHQPTNAHLFLDQLVVKRRKTLKDKSTDLCLLVPDYLIILARVNRRFRSALMSPESNFVWKVVRQNVPGILAPDPPSDMTEPAWANLLYTRLFSSTALPCLPEEACSPFRAKYETPKFDAAVLDLVLYTIIRGAILAAGATARFPQLEAMKSKVTEFESRNISTGESGAKQQYDHFKKTQWLKVQGHGDCQSMG
ncbi:hypothetical protein K438DRAFT_1958137 [Mycena galopus ATCC 62051]|nr:hypothetical protein K438DRAFT_1958137 [Mycena galopus ATCC 62051]